jgi:UDP:flavonoid glycosyltransferase YjiC (YdhE family)
VVVSPLLAHFNARFALVQELAAADAKLGAIYSGGVPSEDIVRRLARFGVESVDVKAATKIATGTREAASLSSGQAGAVRRLERYRRLFIDRDDVDAYRASIRAFSPDVICADPFDYDSLIAAELEGIPYGCVHAGLSLAIPPGVQCGLSEAEAALGAERAAKFRAHGARVPDFRFMAALSNRLNIVWSTRELVGEDVVLPPKTELVGPCIPRERHSDDEIAFPWGDVAADKSVVYVTAGTSYYWQPDYFRVIAEAGASLGVQFIFAQLGLSNEGVSYPGDVIVRSFVPQHAVMDRVDACVSHGGAITLMDSMYYGKPVLIVPFASDQALQAHLVEKAGVGIAITPEKLTPEVVRTAIAQLLQPGGEYSRNARRVAASYRSAPGATRAAQLVLGLARRDT